MSSAIKLIISYGSGVLRSHKCVDLCLEALLDNERNKLGLLFIEVLFEYVYKSSIYQIQYLSEKRSLICIINKT